MSDPRPGRVVWLELNAQRVTLATEFYRALFAWECRPLHVPPWGSIPLISNGGREFANQFMAMGAFATPLWHVRLAADLAGALTRIPAAGGSCRPEIVRHEGFSEEVHGTDPHGTGFTLMRHIGRTVPADIRPGEPLTAEFWGQDARQRASFWAEVLGLTRKETDEGATLMDGERPRLFLRETDYDVQPPRWIPYFLTASLGGDLERARRLGAVVQVHPEMRAGLGEIAVLADPANACFGLVDVAKA